MSQAQANKATVTAFFEALNKNDIDTIVSTYASDGSVRTMGNTLISGTTGRDQIAALSGGILEVFPEGLTFTILDMVAEGDKVAVEATSEGRHASGAIYSNEYHFLFEFVDGKLYQLREYMDTERVTDILCGGQRPE